MSSNLTQARTACSLTVPYSNLMWCVVQALAHAGPAGKKHVSKVIACKVRLGAARSLYKKLCNVEQTSYVECH
jgi:hypothetical protein